MLGLYFEVGGELKRAELEDKYYGHLQLVVGTRTPAIGFNLHLRYLAHYQTFSQFL